MKEQSQNANSSKSSSKKNYHTDLSKVDDIVEMILEDHKPLKKLIQIMKDDEKDLNLREDAFAEFAPLLICHAKPEEQSLYVFMKNEQELREGGLEGEVEHQLADQLCEEIMRTDDPDLWSARVKVLAELVEHHIQEEESQLLPDFRKNSKENDRRKLGAQFLQLKTALLEKGGEETPHESNMPEQPH